MVNRTQKNDQAHHRQPAVRSRRATRSRRAVRSRRAAALLVALFVMSVTTLLVVFILDTQMLQYSSLRNTIDYDRARFLAEAGLQHALSELESDFLWRDGISETEFPSGSGNIYSATVSDGTNGRVVIDASGTSGIFTRHLQTTVKQGG